jgi:hypothetical protein
VTRLWWACYDSPAAGFFFFLAVYSVAVALFLSRMQVPPPPPPTTTPPSAEDPAAAAVKPTTATAAAAAANYDAADAEHGGLVGAWRLVRMDTTFHQVIFHSKYIQLMTQPVCSM